MDQSTGNDGGVTQAPLWTGLVRTLGATVRLPQGAILSLGGDSHREIPSVLAVGATNDTSTPNRLLSVEVDFGGVCMEPV